MVVLIVLYLAPEFFIVSGTEMLKETGGITKMFTYIFSHIGSNATLTFYRTMNLTQLLFFIGWGVLAYPIYWLNRKLVIWIGNKFLPDDE